MLLANSIVYVLMGSKGQEGVSRSENTAVR